MLARWYRELPIRSKLVSMALLPLLVVFPLLGLILLLWSNFAFDKLLITKVHSDLAVAQEYFGRVIDDVGASTAAVADSHLLHKELARRDTAQLVPLLREAKQRHRLDFLNIRSAEGSLLATDAATAVVPTRLGWPGQRTATPRSSVEVLDADALAALAPELVAQVDVRLISTLNAAPTRRSHEDRAMVVLASTPIHDDGGTVIGYLQGGVLLNRNLRFIDHINEIVYPEGSLPFGSKGTATLFLEDVRISTNVRLFSDVPGDRAIGTRVSQTVRDAVLGTGGTWLDRAFVVNDWYVSAYEPLSNGEGQRIGMLYVGFLERPFALLKFGMLAAIGLVFLGVMIAAAVVSLRAARTIFSPIERMAQTMQRVEGGTLAARVGPVESGDEIGRLAGHLDDLLDTIDENTRELQRWNAELDAKVVERTQALEAAQRQLVRSEKLAAVGQLTASIAHEVNNPIAVIQGNLDLAREMLGENAGPVRAELRLIDEQVERMRLIVTQLLQFARPNEFAGYVVSVDVPRLVDDSLVLVAHMLSSTRIELHRVMRANRSPSINRHELQQVLVNLLVNAIHAMPEGGELTISTDDVGSDAMSIAVSDTGNGLDAELISELFQPFVTRKKDGTGLGLWISRSIVERYGGDIRASNRDDGRRGATFVVLLKVS